MKTWWKSLPPEQTAARLSPALRELINKCPQAASLPAQVCLGAAEAQLNQGGGGGGGESHTTGALSGLALATLWDDRSLAGSLIGSCWCLTSQRASHFSLLPACMPLTHFGGNQGG